MIVPTRSGKLTKPQGRRTWYERDPKMDRRFHCHRAAYGHRVVWTTFGLTTWGNANTCAIDYRAASNMREEVLAMFRAGTYSGKDPWSCDNVRALNKFAGVQARSGELAAARAAIQESGKSISDLAKEQIDSLRE